MQNTPQKSLTFYSCQQHFITLTRQKMFVRDLLVCN